MQKHVIILAALFLVPTSSWAIDMQGGTLSTPATGLNANCHQASPQEIQLCRVPAGSVVCPGDGSCSTAMVDAKLELNSMWCGGKPATCGPYTSSINELDPRFAECAARFMKSVRQQDPTICIASAFRTQAHQDYLCGGGCPPKPSPCGRVSNHSQGLAIDIEKPGYKTLPAFVHQMASRGTGVEFPITNDDGHMQPVRGDVDCSTPGYNAPAGPGLQQSGAISSGLRSLFAPVQQMAQPYTAPQSLAQQPVQNAFTQPATTQVQNPTSGTLASVPPTTSNADALLAALKQPSTSPAVAAPKVIAGPGQQTSITPQAIAPQPTATAGVPVPSVGVDQTFTSADLATSRQEPSAPQSRLLAVLATLKEALVRLSHWLTPFGGGTRNTHVMLSQEYGE